MSNPTPRITKAADRDWIFLSVALVILLLISVSLTRSGTKQPSTQLNRVDDTSSLPYGNEVSGPTLIVEGRAILGSVKVLN